MWTGKWKVNFTMKPQSENSKFRFPTFTKEEPMKGLWGSERELKLEGQRGPRWPAA